MNITLLIYYVSLPQIDNGGRGLQCVRLRRLTSVRNCVHVCVRTCLHLVLCARSASDNAAVAGRHSAWYRDC